MNSTAEVRALWAGWRCAEQRYVEVPFPGGDRTWQLLVADESVPAWDWFTALMRRHRYYFRETAGGTYNCRRISGGGWSLHAYAIACDLNPSRNPVGGTDHEYPPGFIEDVLALRTVATDAPVFRWGIVFANPDPMHWEVNCGPDELAGGAYLPGGPIPPNTRTYRGVADVPPPPSSGDDWYARVIDWSLAEGVIIAEPGGTDAHPDYGYSWQRPLTDGRYWTMEYRRSGSP